jgi:20S proteasome subunit alpha 3
MSIIVEFATIQLKNDKVHYELYKPDQINSLLKEQNVGGNTESNE